MKKIFSNNRLIAIAFFTVFSVAVSPAVMANEKNPAVPVEMKLSGYIKNQPVFELNFTGSHLQNEFTIIITDEYGNSLYRENIKGENFSKKFLINTEEVSDNKLRFEVFCNKTRKSTVFEITRNSQLSETVLINELN